MYGYIFKVFGIAIAVLIVMYSAGNAFRKARKLDARIREFKRDQEERKKSGKVQDPYSDLAEIYAESTKPVKK